MTTLDASTIFPENREQTSTFLEVATIRSPYSFTFEEEMSTRFITVTRCVQLFHFFAEFFFVVKNFLNSVLHKVLSCFYSSMYEVTSKSCTNAFDILI